MSGWTEDTLDPEGARQLAALAGAIAREVRPTVIFSSPLRRAIQTACAIARRWPVQLRIDDGLGELRCGDADGVQIRDVQRRYETEWVCNLAQSDPDFRWPGGESYREFRARVLHSLRSIADAAQGQRALLVTHAGVISQVLGCIYGRSPAEWEHFRPRNCSLTSVAWNDHAPRVVAFDVLLSER